MIQWIGWPGLISAVRVQGSTIVLEFPVDASESKQILDEPITVGQHLAIASAELSSVFRAPIVCVPRRR